MGPVNEEQHFCTEENVLECAAYLSQELETLGTGPIIDHDQPDLVRLLNATHDILQYYRSTVKKFEDINVSLHRTRSDLTLQYEAVARLKTQEDNLERTIARQKEKERQLIQRNKALTGKLKLEQEETRRLRLCMNHKDQQYLHDIKKRDNEYTRLKERLGQLVLDKSQERKLGIKMLNSLQKQRRTWNAQEKSGEDMYKLIITHYEDRQKELMLENSSLRESLSNMEKELVSLLNERISELQNGSSSGQLEEDTSPKSNGAVGGPEPENLLGSGYYQMPFTIVREGIEESLRDKYQKLRDHITNLKQKNRTESKTLDYETDIEVLVQQLADCKDIIDQQEQMIRKNLMETEEDRKLHGALNESRILQRTELLDRKEDRIVDREKNVEEREKKIFEIARKLDRERQEFEEVKANFFTQQFLESSVFATPNKSQAQLDSFFRGLNSTPFSQSNRKMKSIGYSTASKSGLSRPILIDSPITQKQKENVIFSTPHLREDLSLTSDDGNEVLNDDCP